MHLEHLLVTLQLKVARKARSLADHQVADVEMSGKHCQGSGVLGNSDSTGSGDQRAAQGRGPFTCRIKECLLVLPVSRSPVRTK